jgi:hypothetical protein
MVVYLESVLRSGSGMAGDDAAVAQSQFSQRESDRIPAIAMVTWIYIVESVRSNRYSIWSDTNEYGGDGEVPGVPEGPVVRHNVIARPRFLRSVLRQLARTTLQPAIVTSSPSLPPNYILLCTLITLRTSITRTRN